MNSAQIKELYDIRDRMNRLLEKADEVTERLHDRTPPPAVEVESVCVSVPITVAAFDSYARDCQWGELPGVDALYERLCRFGWVTRADGIGAYTQVIPFVVESHFDDRGDHFVATYRAVAVNADRSAAPASERPTSIDDSDFEGSTRKPAAISALLLLIVLALI